MKNDITDIAGKEGAYKEVSMDINPMNLEHEILGIVLTKNIHVEFKLTYMNGYILINGNVSGTYETSCSRCLKSIKDTYNVDVNEKFTVESENLDDESYIYKGHFIDLSLPIIDNILLNFPTIMVCDKDCKGLCPICGNDLNISECSCDKNETNIRMEKLKDFFKKQV